MCILLFMTHVYYLFFESSDLVSQNVSLWNTRDVEEKKEEKIKSPSENKWFHLHG